MNTMNKATCGRRRKEAEISPADWKKTLNSIIEQLSDLQYRKMLEYLERIPRYLKNSECRVEMTQKMIEHYGEEESISAVRDVMEQIPRKDAEVQVLLQPFVDKLRKKREKKKKKMSTAWKNTMRSIFKQLKTAQYRRMLEVLSLPAPQRMSAKFKNDLPQKVLEKFGLEESIIKIQAAMAEIPRKDPKVQNLLQPFVDELKKKQDEE